MFLKFEMNYSVSHLVYRKHTFSPAEPLRTAKAQGRLTQRTTTRTSEDKKRWMRLWAEVLQLVSLSQSHSNLQKHRQVSVLVRGGEGLCICEVVSQLEEPKMTWWCPHCCKWRSDHILILILIYFQNQSLFIFSVTNKEATCWLNICWRTKKYYRHINFQMKSTVFAHVCQLHTRLKIRKRLFHKYHVCNSM